MPSRSLQLSFHRGEDLFMRLVISNILEFSEEELCAAANWILQAIRKETVGVTRLGYLIDGTMFDGVFERELDLTTNSVFSLLNDAVIFHHNDIRFSVDEGHVVHCEGMITLFYVREDHRDEEPKNSTEFDSFLERIEARQRSLLDNTGQSYLAYLANDADSMMSFTDFLRKLENRQQAIMKRFPFHSSSSSSETTAIGTPENSPIEIAHEVFPEEDVFHSHLPAPDAELFFDTASEPYCDAAESFDKDDDKVDIAGYLKNMLDDVIQKLDSLEDEKLISFEEALVDHDVRTAVDYFSQRERDCFMSSVESFKQTTPEKASLSMTVATSTDVEGKKEHVQVETQTDKDSDSGEEAAIRECLRTILHRKKMSSSGKKIRINKDGVEESKVIKKSRSSKSPKCSCSEKKKDEPKEEVSKKEKVKKVEKEMKKMSKEGKKEEKEAMKEEKKELKKQKKETKETLKAERRKSKKCLYDFWQPEEMKKEWSLGEKFPQEWFKGSGKTSFDLMAELERALPTSSENQPLIDEPFNRKLREKWAHDGMKSLKMPTPITSIRLPQRHPSISRLDRFQRYSTEEIHDQVMDMYNLVRVDNVNYKIVPRHLGASSGLHRMPKTQSTAPIAVHLAVVDESDPWLNWENHYFKVFRIQNVGNKIVKGAKLEVIHSQNASISRDLSKIPDQISVDYNVDLELLFSLTDKNKEGLVVMQMKNADGGSLSTPFAFVIPKIDIPYEIEIQKLHDSVKKLYLPQTEEPVQAEPSEEKVVKAQSLVEWLKKGPVVVLDQPEASLEEAVKAQPSEVVKAVAQSEPSQEKPKAHSLVEWLKNGPVVTVKAKPIQEKAEAVVKTPSIEKWFKKISAAPVEAPTPAKVEDALKAEVVQTIEKWLKKKVEEAQVKKEEKETEPVTLEVEETQDEQEDDDFHQYDGADDYSESSDEYEMVDSEDAPIDS